MTCGVGNLSTCLSGKYILTYKIKLLADIKIPCIFADHIAG